MTWESVGGIAVCVLVTKIAGVRLARLAYQKGERLAMPARMAAELSVVISKNLPEGCLVLISPLFSKSKDSSADVSPLSTYPTWARVCPLGEKRWPR